MTRRAVPAHERLYTRAEASRVLGITPEVLTQRRVRGSIPDRAVVRTPGGQHGYRADVIDAMPRGHLKPGPKRTGKKAAA